MHDSKLTRAEQKALRPRQILEAAFQEFIARGFTATRVEDIAKRVGVTKGTVYLYFETKELLFEETIRYMSVPLTDIVKDGEILGESPAEQLVALVHILYRHIHGDDRSREVMRLVIAEGHKFPDIVQRHEEEFINPVVNRIEKILSQGAAAGQFRALPARFAELIAAPIVTRTVLRLIMGERADADHEDYIRAHIDLLLNGLQTSHV